MKLLKPQNIFFTIVVIFAIIMFQLVMNHYGWVNGPEYWKWHWQTESTTGFLYLFLGAIPFFLGQYLYLKKGYVKLSLGLLMCSGILLQLIYTALQAKVGIYQRLSDIIMSPYATSYFTAADSIEAIEGFFVNFSDYLKEFKGHAANKPFGIVLFYYGMQALFANPADAAFYASLLLIIGSQFTIPLIFKLVKEIFVNSSEEQAWYAASYFSIIPAFIVVTPEMDQLYPMMTCLLLLYWNRTLKYAKLKDLILFSLTLLVITFITWNVLVVGVFLALFIFWAIPKYKIQEPLLQITKYTSFVFSFVAIFYLLFYLLSGYNVIEVFMVCLEEQSAFIVKLNRPWKLTIWFDLYDFFLGSAYLNVVLLLYILFSYKIFKEYYWLVVILLFQLLFLAVSYLLPAETARVWLFLQPLSIIMSSLCLPKLSKFQVQSLFILSMAICFAISLNMVFINP